MVKLTNSGKLSDYTENEKILLFAWFCVSTAEHLKLGLTADQLTLLRTECLEMAKNCLFAEENNDNQTEMIAHSLLFEVSLDLRHNDDAVLYGNKVISIAEALGDDISKMKTFWSLHRVHYSSQRYTDALSCLKNYCDVAKKSGIKVHEEVYLALGTIYCELNENTIGISNFKKSIEIGKQNGNEYCQMNAYLGLNNAYAETKQFEECASSAKECIRIIQEISAEKAMKSDNQSQSTFVAGINISDTSLGSNAAIAYFDLGKAETNLSLSEDALGSFQKCVAVAAGIGEEMHQVISFHWMAKLYRRKSQWDNVIKFSKKYIDKMHLFHSKDMEIEAYFNIALAFAHKSNYKTAIVYSNKCIEIIGESPDTCESTECAYVVTNTGKKHAEMEAHYLLASAYDQLNQMDNCFKHTNKGIALAEELNDDTSTFRSLQFSFYNFIGMQEKAYLIKPDMKTYNEVPTSLRPELEALVKAVKADNVDQQTTCLNRLYNYYSSKRQYEKAINCMKEIMKLHPNSSEGKLFCYTSIATQYMVMKKYKEGLQYCEGGLREVSTCKSFKFLCYFFYYISLLYAVNDNWQLTEKYLKKAVQYVETLYGSVGSNDDFKMSMIDKYSDCYRLLSLVYFKSPYRRKECLLVLDKCRARVLKDILFVKYGMRETDKAGVDMKFSDIEELVSGNQFAIIYSAICGFNNAFSILIGKNCFDYSTHAVGLERKEYNRMIDKMFDEIEVLQVVNCEDRALDTEQDTRQPEREDEADDEPKNIQVSNGKVTFVVHKKEIWMYHNEKCREATVLEFLYYLILGEKQPWIEQNEIIFIPDGSLCKIPFAALQDPETGKYLSETKRIRVAPSLATLKLLSENAADYHCSGDALVIGDPHVGKVMFDGKEDEISRLEKAQIEAKVVARDLNVEPLLGDKATKPAVLEKLRQGVSVVHIAAHGILSKATIVLAPSPEIRKTKAIPDEEDYMLTMADVQQAQVRAQLVVLSCCHSGRGKIRAEGVVGMCRAFLASGARAVVASLWAIDDEATLEFMVEFYRHLRTGKSAGTSLQLAMNEMRATNSSPKYWAPFFLMGDDVTLKFG